MKRQKETLLISPSLLILDIEGTTTSISFVKDVLFPYIRKHLEEYVEQFWGSVDCNRVVQALRAQAEEDEENKVEGVVPIPNSEEKSVVMKALIENVCWQMDHDRKTKSLKDLQGMIMEDGYKKGELKGHVYEDLEPCLRAWAQQDKSVFIYSSGSVHAQKLLFGYSDKGDLLPLIKGHFDTTVGMKGNSQSYKNILQALSCSPSEAVFLTDIPKEARAAKEAGIMAVLVAREGNAPLSDSEALDFPIICSFEEIQFEQSKTINTDNVIQN